MNIKLIPQLNEVGVVTFSDPIVSADWMNRRVIALCGADDRYVSVGTRRIQVPSTADFVGISRQTIVVAAHGMNAMILSVYDRSSLNCRFCVEVPEGQAIAITDTAAVVWVGIDTPDDLPRLSLNEWTANVSNLKTIVVDDAPTRGLVHIDLFRPAYEVDTMDFETHTGAPVVGTSRSAWLLSSSLWKTSSSDTARYDIQAGLRASCSDSISVNAEYIHRIAWGGGRPEQKNRDPGHLLYSSHLLDLATVFTSDIAISLWGYIRGTREGFLHIEGNQTALLTVSL